MTPDERKTYEQETLEVTRANLERRFAGDRIKFELRDVRLLGSYPDTKVEVTYWDSRYSSDYTSSWAIWERPLYDSDDSYEPPRMAGFLIATWATER